MLFSLPLVESLSLEATFGVPSKAQTFKKPEWQREPRFRYAF